MNISDIRKPIKEMKQAELQAMRDVMKSGGDVNQWLLDNNWSLIDRGKYSKVYENSNSPFIIKALLGRGLTINKKSLRLRCALSWMRFSQKNFHKNKHLPRIYYVQTYTKPKTNRYGTNKTRYFVVMEKLQSSKGVQWEQIFSTLDDIVAVYFMSIYLFNDIWGPEKGIELPQLIQTKHQMSIPNFVKKNATEGHELSTVSLYVKAIQSSFDCVNDLHFGNILMRGNVPVINDPFLG